MISKYIKWIKDRFKVSIPEEVPSIRTHGCAKFWYEHGCPEELGTEIDVEMQSGKIAIFKLVAKEFAYGVDWKWYDLEFVKYKV